MTAGAGPASRGRGWIRHLVRGLCHVSIGMAWCNRDHVPSGWDWYVDDVEQWLAGERTFDDVVESGRRMASHTCTRLSVAAFPAGPIADQAIADLQLAKERLDGLEITEQLVGGALQLRCGPPRSSHRVHGDTRRARLLRLDDDALFNKNSLQRFPAVGAG